MPMRGSVSRHGHEVLPACMVSRMVITLWSGRRCGGCVSYMVDEITYPPRFFCLATVKEALSGLL
jgi:hypothetical protein